MIPASLCESCQHRKDVVTGKGARYLLCLRWQSQSDEHYSKYPPQPVIQCRGFEPIFETREREAGS